jgi:hypothetical protein
MYNRQEYASAMNYYKLGRDSGKYSIAFKEYRTWFMRQHFLFIAAGIALFFAGISLLKKKTKLFEGISGKTYSSESTTYGYSKAGKFGMLLVSMLHPADGFDDMRYNRKTSIPLSFLLFALLILQSVCGMQFTGPQFSMTDPNNVNILTTSLWLFAVLFLFVSSNWAFCVLIDGKAKFSEIWIITNYALLPYTLSGFLNILLSNILTQEEGVFRFLVSAVGIGWSLIMLVYAFISFHEFTLSKTIISITVTVIGMLLIVFLLFLLFSLAQQVSETLITMLNEVIFRVRQG